VLCISDTHFGHVKVFEKFEPIRKTYTLSKGKQTLKDFEDLMVENWNETVFDSDTLIHLGDVCIDKMNPTKTEENLAISLKLEGESLILIKGNHDKSDNSLYYQNGWNFVIDCPVILLDNPKIIDNAPGLAHCIIIDINGKRVMFSHFGIHQYNENFEGKYREPFRYLTKLYNDYKCDYNIHGHSHSNAINSEKSFNCSVEVINFTPKKLTDIFAVLTKFKNKLL
jgi:calcineurin-like phosphoesterase family protein